MGDRGEDMQQRTTGRIQDSGLSKSQDEWGYKSEKSKTPKSHQALSDNRQQY